MKRIYILSAVLLFWAYAAMAQDVRTNKTIVADVLAQLPAANQENYNKQLADLAATGEEGISMVIDILDTAQKGGNVPAEYAVSGLAAYASQKGHEDICKVVKSAYLKGVERAKLPETKTLLTAQLRIMGYETTPVPTAVTSAQTAPTSEMDSKDATKQLLAALKNTDRVKRNSALNIASDYADASMYISVLKVMAKGSVELKEDILRWIAREADTPAKRTILKDLEIRYDLPARQVLINQLKDSNFGVKEAAAWALTHIGDVSVIPVLANLLTQSDKNVVELSKEVLLSFPGDIDQAVAKVIPQAGEAGKIASLQLLAARKADGSSLVVYKQTESPSPNVSAAAYNTLKDVVTKADFTRLCGMLEAAQKKEAIQPLQEAVIASIASRGADEQVKMVTQRMLQAGESKKHMYYTVLAPTGKKQALDIILEGFENGKGVAKEEAFEALLKWKGTEVAGELLLICGDPASSAYFDRALTAYIRLVSAPKISGENRYLKLREAMEIAKTDTQKNEILKQIERTGTFLGMLYAGEFLKEKLIEQSAAQAVMNIALGHKEYTGTVVRDLLAKVSQVLNNPDAGYQREAIRKHLDEMTTDAGFVSVFNGTDLTGWKGLVKNPIERAKMTPDQLNMAQQKGDEQMRKDWKVENGYLIFDGAGYDNLCSVKQYGDIEMYIDWKLDTSGKEADAGIYLRGTPQVQIWDTARVNVGAQVGSGGLYNNSTHPSKPSKVADNQLGEWNTFHIKMVGDRVTIVLNGEKVVDDVILENYWNRKLPIFPVEQIELQAHGSKVYYRDIYIKELPRPEPFQLSVEEKKEGYKMLFDGTNMHEWTGNTVDYTMDNGTISLLPSRGSGGNLYTKDEYGNFIFRFEFQLTPAANNGLGIRTPKEGDAAYAGMELQILDDGHPVYKDLEVYQYHGSVYGVISAERGSLRPTGEWNYQEVVANGDHIKITLNGQVILDGNIREASKNGTIDKKEHPGLLNPKGYIAFLGHGSPVKFRNIRIKELK